MKPTENEITFQITWEQYKDYYFNSCHKPVKFHEAFGINWFVVSLEARQDPVCIFEYYNYFVTFRAVL